VMDCKKCHKQCNADCCGIFFIPKDIFDRNQDKIVNRDFQFTQVDEVSLIEDLIAGNASTKAPHVVAQTKDLKCCFLNKDLSCNIYDDRPFVCRKFGDESSLHMTCQFQAKDGRVRSRQERRSLERKQHDQLMILKEQMEKDGNP
jgi:Fe-S-cluster containining protein